MRNNYLETLNMLKENFNRDESEEMKRGVKFTVKNINSDNNTVTLQWNGEGKKLTIENIVDDSEPTEMNEFFAGKIPSIDDFFYYNNSESYPRPYGKSSSSALTGSGFEIITTYNNLQNQGSDNTITDMKIENILKLESDGRISYKQKRNGSNHIEKTNGEIDTETEKRKLDIARYIRVSEEPDSLFKGAIIIDELPKDDNQKSSQDKTNLFEEEKELKDSFERMKKRIEYIINENDKQFKPLYVKGFDGKDDNNNYTNDWTGVESRKIKCAKSDVININTIGSHFKTLSKNVYSKLVNSAENSNKVRKSLGYKITGTEAQLKNSPNDKIGKKFIKLYKLQCRL